MRVIAGTLGGRRFDSPKGHRTHPMSDKIRGAVFNILGDISDLTVLDAFAGSGALSIEAISRGAESALAIDNDKDAHQAIAKNVEALGLKDKIRVVRQNVGTWSADNQERHFDIVLADPPYDDVQLRYIELLAGHTAAGGLLVLSWPGGKEFPGLAGMDRISDKSYGDARLAVYRKL